MQILIAGGAGFIGSHLIDRLLEEKHQVICADKLIMGDRNIRHLLSNQALMSEGRFKFYQVELGDQEKVDKIFLENQIELVYHLAANSDIQKGGREPEIDFNDTFLTSRALLEGMRKAKVKNLFFASTSAVYGEMPNVKLTENMGGLKPISFYGGAKLASEALISSYVSMCDMKAIIFRFPNVIGPRLTHGVIFDFIQKLLKNNRELEILGDGTQCKPYIYISDLMEAIIRITKNFHCEQEIYNISVRGEGTTVTQIAEIVVDVLGLKNVEFHYTGGKRGWKGDVPRFQYDISKILSSGWEPIYTSNEAVKQTVIELVKSNIIKR